MKKYPKILKKLKTRWTEVIKPIVRNQNRYPVYFCCRRKKEGPVITENDKVQKYRFKIG